VRRGAARDVEVVLIAGVQGAGKSRVAEQLQSQGYERLNRDALGGSLAGVARLLDQRLRAGATRVVLDNTYVTRAARHDVVRVAAAHGARVRCLFLDTPLAQAQVNVVERMLRKLGRVPEPDELRAMARREPAALAPHALQRMVRQLEPPAGDEGFAAIEVVPFVREPAEGARGAVVIAIDALAAPAGQDAAPFARQLERHAPATPCLLYAWRPGIDDAGRGQLRALADAVARASGRAVDVGVCPHPAGSPICWCRPPLPALPLTFAHRHGIDLPSSTLIGASAADRALARALGATFVAADDARTAAILPR
jgi:predicted kinase